MNPSRRLCMCAALKRSSMFMSSYEAGIGLRSGQSLLVTICMVAAPLQKGFTPSLNRPAGQSQPAGLWFKRTIRVQAFPVLDHDREVSCRGTAERRAVAGAAIAERERAAVRSVEHGIGRGTWPLGVVMKCRFVGFFKC